MTTDNILIKVLFYFERLKNAQVIFVCLITIIILGWLDMISGFDYSFSFFYLIPVSIASWGIGRRAGLAISVVCAIVWMLSNFLAGEVYASQFVAVWNTLMRFGFFVVVSVLLSHLRIALHRERNLAQTDGLTGLINKSSFLAQIQNQLELKNLTGKVCTLVYLDLDDFKKINDLFGHSAGDLVLTAVAEALQHSIRFKDFAGRLGGDEFGLMLAETDPNNVKMIIGRLQNNLSLAMQNNDWAVTFSIGVVIFNQQLNSVSEMLAKADTAMYKAKNSGKNQYAIEIYP